jgi:hypothetical protein
MSFGSNPGDPLPYAEATGQAPADGGSDPESAPPPAVSAPGAVSPCVQCTIASETVMTQPDDRARRNIGVGERVRLTFSLGNANWTITAGHGALSSASGTTVVLTAPGVAQSVTVSATGGGCTATIDFSIIAPNDVRMTRIDTLHQQNTHKIGMHTRIFFLPDTVNFHRVEYLEDEVMCTATGIWTCINNTGHGPATTPFPGTTRVVAGYGTRIGANDMVRSGWCNGGTTQADGRISWPIPWKYRVQGLTTYHPIRTVTQVCTSNAAGQLRANKAHASASATFAGAGTW